MYTPNVHAPGKEDALIAVDVQNDFLPGGALGVTDGDAVIPVLNEYIELFRVRKLPIFATADWHPAGHCSFSESGGQWPKHCVADSAGAQFADDLQLPDDATIVRKGMQADIEAYSGFQGTDLAAQLNERGITRVFVGGLATDYCVLNTVTDALANGFDVVLLTQAIRAVDVDAGDGARAIESMRDRGAIIHDSAVPTD
jgi:nicotinamidase/pyrazinamidase